MTTILFRIVRIYRPWFKCNYLKNEKLFIIFSFHFRNLHPILNILREKMIVIVTLIWKLQTVKHLFRSLSKKHRFRTSFDSQHLKGCQTLAKGAWEHFCHFFSSPWEILIWKISQSVICQILETYCHILTSSDNYPVQDCQNLSSSIQMQLS